MSDSLQGDNIIYLISLPFSFELVVDGGFLIQLEFIRHPTSRFTAQLDVYVPVNQIVNIGDFYLMDRKNSVLSSPVYSRYSIYEGGMLPATPIFGDLWITGLLPSVNPNLSNDFCPPDVHDISLLGGPSIEPNSSGIGNEDDISVCLDQEGVICASSSGVFSHRYSLKVGTLGGSFSSPLHLVFFLVLSFF